MKKQLLIHLILILVLGLALGGGKVLAQTSPPQEIKLATTVELPIQGRLLTASGAPVNGVVNVGFRLYSAASEGTLYCEDLHAVTVADGLYSTTLQCPRQYLDGRDLYLAVKLEGDDEMTPVRRSCRSPTLPPSCPGHSSRMLLEPGRYWLWLDPTRDCLALSMRSMAMRKA